MAKKTTKKRKRTTKPTRELSHAEQFPNGCSTGRFSFHHFCEDCYDRLMCRDGLHNWKTTGHTGDNECFCGELKLYPLGAAGERPQVIECYTKAYRQAMR